MVFDKYKTKEELLKALEEAILQEGDEFFITPPGC